MLYKTCDHCGGETEFRCIDGLRVPLHVGGGCSGGGDGGSWRRPPPVHPSSVVRSFESSGWREPSRCPRCSADVYFVRHNGGSVWLDDLGPPWPRHGCFDRVAMDRVVAPLQILNRKLSGGVLGLVVRTRIEADRVSVSTLLAVECSGMTRICVTVSRSHAEIIGSLILVEVHPTKPFILGLHRANGPVIKVSNFNLDPSMLELPHGWSVVRGKPAVQPPDSPPQLNSVSGAWRMVTCVRCLARVRSDRFTHHTQYECRRWKGDEKMQEIEKRIHDDKNKIKRRGS